MSRLYLVEVTNANNINNSCIFDGRNDDGRGLRIGPALLEEDGICARRFQQVKAEGWGWRGRLTLLGPQSRFGGKVLEI